MGKMPAFHPAREQAAWCQAESACCAGSSPGGRRARDFARAVTQSAHSPRFSGLSSSPGNDAASRSNRPPPPVAADALYFVLNHRAAAQLVGSYKLSCVCARANRRCRQLVQRVLQQVVWAETFLYEKARGRAMERWAKGPTGDAGRSPGALGAVVGSALQQMLHRVQKHSDERGAAVEAKFPDIHKAAGPFGIVLTAEGVISVLSNGELRELAENAGIRAEEEGSATWAIINGKVWMHFPVNEQAEQDQEGGGICRTMAACLTDYKEPMCAALRHKLLTNPSLQRIILVVADLLPCVFPPKSGLNHQFLQRYHMSCAQLPVLSCPLFVLNLQRGAHNLCEPDIEYVLCWICAGTTKRCCRSACSNYASRRFFQAVTTSWPRLKEHT